MADEDTAYDRGVAAGEIAARLAGHDQHFAAINGSLGRIAAEMHGQATELHGLALLLQELGQDAKASAATVIATAKALKEAEEARRTNAEQSWSPVAKLIAVLATVATLVGTVVGLYLALR